jgi:hypothetical protein
MNRARRHRRLFSFVAFGLLAVTAELVGAGLVQRMNVGRHVSSPSYRHAVYYPALLIAVKIGIALLLASVLWRVLRARATERTARRVLGVLLEDAPRVRIVLSPRICLAFFLVTATTYLVHADAMHVAGSRWALVFPWVHTSALPVFAVLSIVMSVVCCAVERWLTAYELYAEAAAARARSLRPDCESRARFPRIVLAVPPRRLFGLVLDGRPPPLTA